MKTLCKGILSFFIGMALVSCAGTDSSVQTKVEEKSNLFKPGVPVADSLVSSMPEFARSVFKEALDSVSGECYYHVTNGRIDTLFKKDDGLYKTVVSVAYDSVDGQNNYELRKGSASYRIEKGTLFTELYFPKHVKKYWSNGKLMQIATGLLYIDDQGVIKVDSGHSELYFENGKISQQNDWVGKQGVASKQWNENGVLVKEWSFPNYYKEYWDNGKTKEIGTGRLYWDDQGVIKVDSGHSETYFENGKISQQNEWMDKQGVASMQWNENGVLIKDVYLPKFAKEYWDNGILKNIMTGLLYKDDQGAIEVDSGHSELYFENGKINQRNDWRNRQIVAGKTWNENGILTVELNFPKYLKAYWDNGNPKTIMTGLLYKDDHGSIKVDSGHSEINFENGKIKQQNDWKDKQLIVQKEWNGNGVLIIDIDFPNYYKDYWNNGSPKTIMTGFLYKDDRGSIKVDSGHSETYFENGKINQRNDWRNRQIVANKTWNENGIPAVELNFPKYLKTYWVNGSPKTIKKGLLYRDDHGSIEVDSGRSEVYFENGKISQQIDWKNRQIVAGKIWNENGTVQVEGDASKGIQRKYFPNGKISLDISGKFHYDDNGNVILENATEKLWGENGNLTAEIYFPNYVKMYYDNGKPSVEMKGTLYYDDQNRIQVQDGFEKIYRENGKLAVHKIYKGKAIVGEKFWYENGAVEAEGDVSRGFYKGYFPNGKLSVDISGKFHYDNNTIVMESGSKKWWYENGNLEYELVFPKHEKKYSDNGTLVYESEGTLFYDNQNKIQIQDGVRKEYSDNGNLVLQKNYKGKKIVGKTVWNESGIITISAELPSRYREFYDNGKLKVEVTGTIVEEEDSFKIKDGTYKEYDPNGKVTYTAIFKDFQRSSEKTP